METDRSPRVSVVMPLYNTERYVGRAVASVLASRFVDLELLVLDDGSTDGSLAAAERAADGDPRVRLIGLPHGGVALARNAGLQAARGEFIANLDADDLMFPGRLARQVQYLERHPECVGVGSRALVIDADGVPQRVGVRYFTHEEIDGAHMAGIGGAIWNPTATFRREAAVRVGGYDPSLAVTGEDRDLWLRLAEIGRLANLPDVLSAYRIHGANVSLLADGQERRRDVALDATRRAHERRGLRFDPATDRSVKPLSASARRRDEALVRYFQGKGIRAFLGVVAAVWRSPGDPAARGALRTVRSGVDWITPEKGS